MESSSFLSILTIIMGLLMSIGYFPQAYRIYKHKSSRDISIPSFIIFSLGTLTWTVYGLVTRDLTILAGFILGVIGSWAVLLLALKYRKN